MRFTLGDLRHLSRRMRIYSVVGFGMTVTFFVMA